MSETGGTSYYGKNYSDANGGGPMRRHRREGRSSRRGGESSGVGGNNFGGGGGGRHGAHPESRDENNPCRSLFVRNLQFDTTEEEIYRVFGPYGDLKSIFSRISERGIVFVHYYDLRAAEKAKADCGNIRIGGRELDIHYSFPKDNIRIVKCDETKNQGTLLLSLNGTSENLVDEELYEHFEQFGEVKVIRTPAFKTYSENTERWQRLLEYYDSRAAVRAAKATHGKEYKTGVWDVNFFWDQGLRNNVTRDSSPSRRGGDRHKRHHDQKQPRHHEPYSSRRDHDQRMVRFSPPATRTQPPYGTSPQINNVLPPPPPMAPPQLDNTQKAQKLISLLQALQNPSAPQPPPTGQPFHPAPPQPTSFHPAPQGQVQQLLGILTQMAGNAAPPPQQPVQPQKPMYTPWTEYQQPYQYPQQPQQPYQYSQQPQQPQQPLQPQYPQQSQQPQHSQHPQQEQQEPSHMKYSPQYAQRSDTSEAHPPYSPNLPYNT